MKERNHQKTHDPGKLISLVSLIVQNGRFYHLTPGYSYIAWRNYQELPRWRDNNKPVLSLSLLLADNWADNEVSRGMVQSLVTVMRAQACHQAI